MTSFPGNNRMQHLAPEPLLKRLLRTVQRRWEESKNTFFFLLNGVRTQGGVAPKPAAPHDQRRHPRIHLDKTSVHVTDGCLFATARIDNISPDGICLCHLPERLYCGTGRLTVFSSENPALPVLQIEPRWEQTSWGGKTIGAAILNATDAWRLFFVHNAGRQGA